MMLAGNNTGATVNQVITTPDGSVTVSFTYANNIESITGSLTLTVGPSGSPLLTRSPAILGSAKPPLQLPAYNIMNCRLAPLILAASGLTPTGSSSPVAIENGTLGLVLFSDTNGTMRDMRWSRRQRSWRTSGAWAASATLQIERNTSTIEAWTSKSRPDRRL